MRLDGLAGLGQMADFFDAHTTGADCRRAQIIGDVDGHRATCFFFVDDHDLFVRDADVKFGKRLFVENELVGRNRTRHDRFAKSPAGVDHNLSALVRNGIGGKHHAGLFAGHHFLHDGAQRNAEVIVILLLAVIGGAGRPERSPALPHVIHDRRRSDHMQVSVLLSGERGVGQVLRGGGASDGDVGLFQPHLLRQFFVGFDDLLFDVSGNRRFLDQGPNRFRLLLKRCRVFKIQPFEKI